MPESDSVSINGYVLIGGQSRRMGHDKASILVDGRPAVTVMLDRLSRAGCSSVHAVAPHGLNPVWDGHATVHDAGQGPLGALHAVLANCTSDWAVVVAVDHLGLTAEPISCLVDVARDCRDDVDVVVARGNGVDERVQNLISVWRTASTAHRVESMWTAGSRSVAEVIEVSRVRIVDLRDDVTRNINTPGDLRAFEANG